MSPRKSRIVTACQQLLALGVVLAVLTPAAAVVSLDVIGQVPGTTRAPSPPSAAPAPAPDRPRDAQPGAQGGSGETAGVSQPRAAGAPTPSVPPSTAEVPSAPVDAQVTEVALTSEDGAATGNDEPGQPSGAEQERQQREQEAPEQEAPEQEAPEQETPQQEVPEEAAPTRVVSDPQQVRTFGTVGITWSSEDALEEEDITLEVRSRTGETWSDWTALEYHDEHAPDPGTPEAEQARPGTEPEILGDVDAVQVAATAPAGLPRDLSLAVVEPGTPEATETEGPQIEVTPDGAVTEDARGSDEGVQARESSESSESTEPDSGTEGAMTLQADVKAPKPTIYSRAQWGANERLRDGSPSYGAINAGFVHHTVNGNDYSRAEVPGILRSIYAYHTQSRGWSDIGYNFLVDKFGRIWEGRYGGVARPVIGAHTLGYNDDAFAMSAIGNFETARPTDAMLKAYGALFAWKLGLHGIRASDMTRSLDGDRFAAINGHRDAGSTACPGRYLYDRLGRIRTLAQQAQDADGSTPEPEPEEPTVPTVTPTQVDSDLAGSDYPDLVVRRASDGRGMIVPTGGLTRFTRPGSVGGNGWDDRRLSLTPDMTGDGVVDLLVADSRGRLEIRPGNGGGSFDKPARRLRNFRRHSLPVGAGDLDGDGRSDVAGRRAGELVSFLRTERGGFQKVEGKVSLRGFSQLSAAGDVTGDGVADLWGRDREDRLVLLRGRGDGTFAAPRVMPGSWSGYAWFAGGTDHTLDGRPDVLAMRKDGRLMVLPSRGNGTLARQIGPVLRAKGLVDVAGAGQLAGGATADLLAVTDDGALAVASSRGTYELGQPIDTRQSFGPGNLLLNAGDFDGDGDGDVILRRRRGTLRLFAGDGTGRLADPVRIGDRYFGKVRQLRVTGDVTGDDKPDILGVRDGVTRVWEGKGTQRIDTSHKVKVREEVATADFDAADYAWRIRVSDLRLKGAPDLLVREGDTGWVKRVNGTAKRTLRPRYLGELKGYDLGG